MITFTDDHGLIGTVRQVPGGLAASVRPLQRAADQALAREHGNVPAAYARLLRSGNAYVQVREAGGIGAQFSSVLDFTHSPAWLHELRGPDGEWVHSPSDVPGEGLDRYKVPPHGRLINPRAGYPDPADLPFFRKHPVSAANIVKAYDATPAEMRPDGMHWYSSAHLLARGVAHGDAEKGAILLANYSPTATWPINMFRAARAFDDGKPIPAGEGYVTGDQVRKAQKALDGAHIDQVLTSPKTRSFAHLIAQGDDSPDDPYGHVVIDAHALNVAAGGTVRGLTYGSDKRKHSLPPEDDAANALQDARGHEYVADQYRQAAKIISQRDGVLIKPHQLQAVTWVQQVLANMAADRAEVEASPHTGRAKGRLSAKAKDWQRWLSYAKSDQLPMIAGVSALSGTIFAQVLELAVPGVGDQVMSLAGWEHEARDRRGRWEHGPAGTAVAERPVTGIGGQVTGRTHRVITADEARGNSRPVSMGEFQRLAAIGNAQLDRMKRDAAPVTGLTRNWQQVTDHAWEQVRKPWGGATIDSHSGVALASDADRYALSVKPAHMSTVSVPEDSSRAEFDAAMDRALASFRPVLERRGFHLGVFHDDDNHRIDIDPVAVVGTPYEVETLGAYTHAVGGAYHFRTGDGYWPPHVARTAEMSQQQVHWEGPGQWRSAADDAQDGEPEDDATIGRQAR